MLEYMLPTQPETEILEGPFSEPSMIPSGTDNSVITEEQMLEYMLPTQPETEILEGPLSEPSMIPSGTDNSVLTEEQMLEYMRENNLTQEDVDSAQEEYRRYSVTSPYYGQEAIGSIRHAYVAMPRDLNSYMALHRTKFTTDPTQLAQEERKMKLISIDVNEWAYEASNDDTYWTPNNNRIVKYRPQPTIFRARYLPPKLQVRYTESEIQALGRYQLWKEHWSTESTHLLRGPQWTDMANDDDCFYNISESVDAGELSVANHYNLQPRDDRDLATADDLRILEQWNRYTRRGGTLPQSAYEQDLLNLSPSRERISQFHPYRNWIGSTIGIDPSEITLGALTRRWMDYRETMELATELYSPDRINRVRVQREIGNGVARDSEANDDDVLGIMDSGAQISTIPEMLITKDEWIASRRSAPVGTAIKYGNNDIQEVYSQIDIGNVLFQVTPNRCSNALISVHQLTELGHAITLTQHHMCIDDVDLQYGMRFKKLAETREWKMPLSAIDKLAQLRLAHPRGPNRASSKRSGA